MNERKHGPCWEATCGVCGQANAWLWQEDEPTTTAGKCGWCDNFCDWVFVNVPPVTLGRLSGYSTSESDFTPHKNRSLGTFVESLSHMKQLQAAKGCEDAVVKGDGAERHAPRDVLERAKRHNETRRQLAAGKTLDYGHGVTARMEG